MPRRFYCCYHQRYISQDGILFPMFMRSHAPESRLFISQALIKVPIQDLRD